MRNNGIRVNQAGIFPLVSSTTSSLMTVALLNDLRAEVIFLPKSANTIFASYVTSIYLF